MSFSVKVPGSGEGEKEFELAPEGTHPAVCYRVYDVGTQAVKGKFALDEEGKQKYKRTVYLAFELSNELMADGRPFAVSRDFTLSLDPKAKLRAFLESWLGAKFEDGATFDLDGVLGKPALLSVVHSKPNEAGRQYANVGGVLPLPKGMPKPKNVNPLHYFTFNDYRQEDFDAMPEGLRKKAMESKEYKARGTKSDNFDEDLPF